MPVGALTWGLDVVRLAGVAVGAGWSADVVEAAALRLVVVDRGAGEGVFWIRGGGAARLAVAEAVAPGAADDVAGPAAAPRGVDAPELYVIVAVAADGLEASRVPARGREVLGKAVEHVIH